jgi:hypothetical protein
MVEAVLAQVGVLARRLTTHQPAHLATETAERVLAHLAARVVREPTKDTLRFLERLVPVDEQRLPVERLRHPAIIAVPAGDCPGTTAGRL